MAVKETQAAKKGDCACVGGWDESEDFFEMFRHAVGLFVLRCVCLCV